MLKNATPVAPALRDGGAPTPHRGGAKHAIALVQSSSLPSLVQRELERMILAGDLRAGAKLNEAEIAAQLGVSRGPVREAFRALEESGLVRLEKNRGVFVRQISVDEADQIYELRAVLEDFAGRRVAEYATPDAIAELFTLVERMERAVARADAAGYFNDNLTFHDRLVDIAGNAKLTLLYRRLVNELLLYRRAALDQADSLPTSVREHRAIVERLAARQPAAAGRLLSDHVLASRERMHRKVGVVTPPPPRRATRRAR
jgi:phosphonate utilization transcriptional regulator